jgi:phosphoribosyl-dephospho-CoA transferase
MRKRLPAAANHAWTDSPACQAGPAFRPHDLLWAQDWHGLVAHAALPFWVLKVRDAGDPVIAVVRREALSDPALVPVGLRGSNRSQRLGVLLQRAAVVHCVSPEMLIDCVTPARQFDPDASRVIAALDRMAPLLNASGLCWGPTGSLGYALATGLPALHSASDIDLLVRAPFPLFAWQAQLLHAAQASSACQVDMQIDTGRGGFSFAEWAKGGSVLLKTDFGPFLTRNPWNLTGRVDAVASKAA